MILLIQILLSLGLTVIYALQLSFNSIIIDAFKVVLVLLGINIALILAILLSFIAFVYLTEKTNPKGLIKHKIYNHYNHYIFNFLYRVKPVVIGRENLPKDNNFVVYSNHIEYTDPLYIKQVYKDFPLAFVSKEELHKYPFMKNVLVSTGCVPLSRKAGDRQALEAILKAIKQVKDGQPMAVFPEGTRSHTNSVSDFKTGSFKLAQKAKADISIIVLYNMHKTIDIFKIMKVKVYLKVLPLIKYDDYKDLDTNAISDLVHKKMVEELLTMKEMS